MGTQKGALRLKGTHGDFTFVETTDGFIWKKKRIALTMEKISTDPAYVKTKDHISEFGRAGKATKLIREAFENQLKFAKDRRLTSRLTTLMVQVVKSDPTNDRGFRVAQNGDLSILEKFEMNGFANLHNSMPVQLTVSYNRVTGEIEVSAPSFVPSETLNRAANVTHFRVICAAAELDFDNDASATAAVVTAGLPINNVAMAPISLTPAVTPGSSFPVLISVGIQFGETVNGFEHWERNGEFNALSIVKTDSI